MRPERAARTGVLLNVIVAAPGVRGPEERGGGDGDVSGAVEGDAVNRAGGLECGGGEGVR